MHPRTLLSRIVSGVALIAIVGLASFFVYVVFGDQIEGVLSSLMPSAAPAAPIISLQAGGGPGSVIPARIKIPAIGIDTTVENVGIIQNGAMGVPQGPTGTGWFDLGTHPGDVGSAVIDGHSGFKNNQPAVFDNLYKLNIGDKIYVEDEKGNSVMFVVRGYKSYGRNENPTDVFVSSDGKAHLNLITCAGDWNPIAKTHSNRLVIFADKA